MGTTIGCPCANSDDGETENGISTNYNHNYNLYNSLRLTMQNNEILYKSSSKSREIITKICIIQSEKIELFFNSLDLFIIPDKYIIKPLMNEKDKSDSSKKIFYFDNVHISNYLQNQNYILIYLQTQLKEELYSLYKSPYKIVTLNLGSYDWQLIKEQLTNDLSSMLKHGYIFLGIVYTGNYKYQMLYKYDKFKQVQYHIEIYESNYKSLEKSEICDILRKKEQMNNPDKINLICVIKFNKEEKTGSTFFCIYEENLEDEEILDRNEIKDKEDYENKIIPFIREQYPTEQYVRKLSEESNKRGVILSAVDSGDRTYIIFK